jgi:hypothetical protein
MSSKNFLRKIGGFILAALLVTGMAVSTGSTTAQAQGRRVIIVRPVYRPYYGYGWYHYRRPFGYPFGWNSYYSEYVFSNGEAAASQGYHDGFKTGTEDGRKRKSYDPERSHYFHDAGFGNFAEAYRAGFERGYRDGYGPA